MQQGVPDMMHPVKGDEGVSLVMEAEDFQDGFFREDGGGGEGRDCGGGCVLERLAALTTTTTEACRQRG